MHPFPSLEEIEHIFYTGLDLWNVLKIYSALLQFIWQQSLFQDLIKGCLQIERVIAMNIMIQ